MLTKSTKPIKMFVVLCLLDIFFYFLSVSFFILLWYTDVLFIYNVNFAVLFLLFFWGGAVSVIETNIFLKMLAIPSFYQIVIFLFSFQTTGHVPFSGIYSFSQLNINWQSLGNVTFSKLNCLNVRDSSHGLSCYAWYMLSIITLILHLILF